MGYALIRHQFIKTFESFSGRVKHDNRTLTKTPENVIAEKSHLNVNFVEARTTSSSSYLKEIETELKEYKKEHPDCKNRNLKKGSAFAFETVIVATDKDMSDTERLEFYKEAFQKFQEKYKGHEILSANVHMDEKQPHLHIVTSLFSHEKKKWCRRDLFGYERGKEKSFGREQDWVHDLGKKYGLERGIEKKITKREYQAPLHPNQVKTIKLKMEQKYYSEMKLTPEVEQKIYERLVKELETKVKQEKREELVAKYDEYLDRINQEAFDAVHKEIRLEKQAEVEKAMRAKQKATTSFDSGSFMGK